MDILNIVQTIGIICVCVGVGLMLYRWISNAWQNQQELNYERTDESYDLEAKYRTEILNNLVSYIFYWLGWDKDNTKVKYTPTGFGEDLLVIEGNRVIFECTFYWDAEIISIKGIVDNADEKYYEKIKNFALINKTLDTKNINKFIMKIKDKYINFGVLTNEDREDLIASAIKQGQEAYESEDAMKNDLYNIMECLIDLMFSKDLKKNRNLNLVLTRLFMVFGKEYGEDYINHLKNILEEEQKSEK